MRLRSVPLLMLIVPAVLASENYWPVKGDTVYVSASFKKLKASSPAGGGKMSYDMPACSALMITKADSKKRVWVAKDPLGGTEKLSGGWLTRMHSEKSDCEAQHSKAGEPNVTRSGATFKIVSSDDD